MRATATTAPSFTVGWHDAIFEHYRSVDDAALTGWLPPGLELDRHEGRAFVSVVSFRMSDMRWRGIRLPFSHTYPQVNVRAYVRSRSGFGVFFLRNYVSNPLAAVAGRWLYGMPYRAQRVRHAVDGDRLTCSAELASGARHHVAGRRVERLTGHEADAESLRFFLVERYPLFSARGRAGARRTHEAAMAHPPWALHRFDVEARSHGVLDDLGLRAALEPVDEVHTSLGVDVSMWPPRACSPSDVVA